MNRNCPGISSIINDRKRSNSIVCNIFDVGTIPENPGNLIHTGFDASRILLLSESNCTACVDSACMPMKKGMNGELPHELAQQRKFSYSEV